jgi:ribosomal protein S18 acetylase RimI-like enzyme
LSPRSESRQVAELPLDPIDALNRVNRMLMTGSAGVSGSEAVLDPDVTYATLGVPIAVLNSVFSARFAAESADRRIGEIVDWYGQRGHPFSWWLGPDSEPADLAKRLVQHGFVLEDEHVPGMAAVLNDLPAVDMPRAMSIDRVRDATEFRTFCDVLAAGFEAPSLLCDAFFRLGEVGFGDEVPFRHYVATVDARPVATTTGVIAGDVLGIYNVATVPDARGRGIGRTITLESMRDGARAGCGMAVLEASEMGRSVYEKLGFSVFADYQLFVHEDG